jgi:DNA polymerase III sliding clamp (beta) subunit (PCNA family)
MVDNLLRQREKIDDMLKNYQQPMNVFNVGTQVDFEARMLTKDENPKDIIIQRKTAFISLENALLTIKEINGDMKEYEIILPKTPEQIENEELKKKIKELEKELKKNES